MLHQRIFNFIKKTKNIKSMFIDRKAWCYFSTKHEPLTKDNCKKVSLHHEEMDPAILKKMKLFDPLEKKITSTVDESLKGFSNTAVAYRISNNDSDTNGMIAGRLNNEEMNDFLLACRVKEFNVKLSTKFGLDHEVAKNIYHSCAQPHLFRPSSTDYPLGLYRGAFDYKDNDQ